MSEMVERVAAALCVEAGDEPYRDYIGMGNTPMKGWKMHERAARAAIEAMREPTEAMLTAGDTAMIRNSDTSADAWPAMIDAALTGTMIASDA